MSNNKMISVNKLDSGNYAIVTLIRTRSNAHYKTVNTVYCKNVSFGPISNSLFCCNEDFLISNMDLDNTNIQDLTNENVFKK